MLAEVVQEGDGRCRREKSPDGRDIEMELRKVCEK